jgi:hypothetical protein
MKVSLLTNFNVQLSASEDTCKILNLIPKESGEINGQNTQIWYQNLPKSSF